MKKLTMLLFVALMSTGVPAVGQEVPVQTVDQPSEEATQEDRYVFPTIAPEVRVFGGYRFVGSSGSPTADQYEYLHSSPVFGGEAAVFSFPHRAHLEVDYNNEKDYFGDGSYAYKDIVLFRGIERSLFHNLPTIRLIDLDPATPTPGVSVRDANATYGERFGMTTLFLRFKPLEFPFHIYIDGTLIDRDGTQQQRSLLGSGYFNNIVRDSRSRDIDMQTKNLVLGMNSHLGPVELDVSHGETRLDVSGDKVLFDNYTAAGSLQPRAAGEYPHNLIPDFKGSSNTLKIHTSYTGSIVASGALSTLESNNQDSGAKADYFIGTGEVSWMASNQIAFFVKYRHKEADFDVPSQVTITDVANPANSYTYLVQNQIPYMTDTISAQARLRPISGVTLLAEYVYENVRRTVPFESTLPPFTRKNAVSLSTILRVINGVNLKASYTHSTFEDPAYDTDPDHSDEARLSITWIPLPRITALLTGGLIRAKRDDLNIVAVPAAKNRDADQNSLLGSVTYLLFKDLSLTASYAYMDTKVQQDIGYQNLAGVPQVDPNVPYKDVAHTYSLTASYLPVKPFSLNASVSYTIGSGTFYPGDPNLTQPISISSFSATKIRETVYSTSGEYRFKNGYAAGLQYRYTNFEDVLDNPYDSFTNGRAHSILLTVSKKW